MEQLVDELQILVNNDKVMSVKDHVEEIKKAFLAQYNFIEEKKEEYQAENPDTTEDFQYQFPLKVKFDQSYSIYKDNKIYISKFTNKFEINLENRLAIVEELKELINPQENIKDTLKHFNELRDR
jgi:soluble cytochrome b562